jgi:hypothetical protein
MVEFAWFFRREPMTVSLGVIKIEERFRQDGGMAEQVKIIEGNLKRRAKKKYFITIA